MDSYETQRKKFLQEKYKIKNGRLLLEGQTIPQDDGRPLSEIVQELERDKQKGFKLSVASVPFQGRKVRMWYDVRF